MQLCHLKIIYGKAEAIKKKYGFVKGGQKTLLKNETLAAEGMPTLKQCLSKTTEYYYNFIHALYNWMTSGHEQAYEFSKQLVQIKNSTIASRDYINGLLEHVTCCVRKKEIKA